MNGVKAPWTDEQVRNIRSFQECTWVHPFTCGKRDDWRHDDGMRWRGDKDWGVLQVKNETLFCPDCDYTQTWVHDFMANTDWTDYNPLTFGSEHETVEP